MKPFRRAPVRGSIVGLLLVLGAAVAAGEPRFSTPARDDVLASGVVHEVRWRAFEEESGGDEMELVLSVDGGWTFPIRLTADLSPRSSSFRWKVPALSTRRAVLGVRRGIEGEPESERVVFVSDEFRITAFETSPTSSLVRGPSEWWTEQALLEISAEGLLGGSFRGSPERLAAPVSDNNIDKPAWISPPSFEAARHDTVVAELAPASTAPARDRRSLPLPLRE